MAKRRSSGTKAALSDEQIAASRREADAQLRRRDQSALRARRVQDLESIERMLDNSEHPLWWVLSFIQINRSEERADESFSEAVARLTRELAASTREALQMAQVLLMMQPVVDTFSGKKQARPKESRSRAMTRILLEQGTSSYAAVRAAGEHDAHVRSDALPDKDVRAARRMAQEIRDDAAQKHGKLVNVVVSRSPVMVGPPRKHIKDGLLALVDGAVRAEERRQAEIVKRIDGNRPRSRRSRG